MFIHEAIKATTVDEPFITREAWRREEGTLGPKILPTNTPDCCLAKSSYSDRTHRGWEPFRNDLLADDWITSK